jgi:hypothetical protein
VLISVGGVAAAVAVVGTLFLWPAPRTTNSAASRPAPGAPAAAAPVEPTPSVGELEIATIDPTPTRRVHSVTPRVRRSVAPDPPSASAPETTPAPTASTEAPASTTAPPPSASETAPASSTAPSPA